MSQGLSRSPILLLLVTATVLLFATADASATPPGGGAILVENPIGAVEQAASELGLEGGLSTSLNIVVLLTVLAIVPSVFILCTCFTRIVIVLSLLRQALGTQGLPPSQIIVGLSLFLTLVVMLRLTLRRCVYFMQIQMIHSKELLSRLLKRSQVITH